MNELYDKKYLFDTLFLLEKEIQDLNTWSAYNNDLLNDKIVKLIEQNDEIRKELIELDKQGQLKDK